MSPSVYKRKPNSQPRVVWSEADLINAVKAVSEGTGVNAAAKQFGIPKTTLKRRIKRKNFTVENRLGPSSSLGSEAEKKLAQHIIKLQRNGFCPTRTEVCASAFQLAETLKIPHKFNKGTRLAGMDWLRSFLRRNPEIRVRKAEGVSTARTLGLSKTVVKNYFELLENLMRSNDLFDKPGHVFNVDETGLQLNNKPGQVLAQRGSKSVSVVTSGEKGETISVIACCNAEGSFLPPYCIFKGKNKKDEFADGMPPGSEVVMSQKSAYVNLQIFQNWIKDHFFPRKPHGKVLLVLDGHTSHTASVETLEFCEQNDIILLSLPSHTTHYLQPLDRSFFKSLKTFYYADCNSYMRSNPSRRITRLNFGSLLGSSWARAATVQNAVSGFKATGIMPFNPRAIPDYAFLSDFDDTNNSSSNSSRNSTNIQIELAEKETEDLNLPSTSGLQSKRKDPKKRNMEENDSMVTKKTTPKKMCSRTILPPESNSSDEETVSVFTTKTFCTPSPDKAKISMKKTPGTLLDEISPIPNLKGLQEVRKRATNIAIILTNCGNIEKLKTRKAEKALKEQKKNKRQIEKNSEKKHNKKTYQKNNIKNWSDSEESDDIDVPLDSEFECEEYSDDDYENLDSTVKIEMEKYYCVYYDDRYYVGRIVSLEDDKVTMKFLKPDLEKWIWPKADDITKVDRSFIFYGPLHVNTYPFLLNRHDLANAEKKYKEFKKQ